MPEINHPIAVGRNTGIGRVLELEHVHGAKDFGIDGNGGRKRGQPEGETATGVNYCHCEGP